MFTIRPIVKVKSLSSVSKAYVSTLSPPQREHIDFIETEGRLLILTILNKEEALKSNKRIHDNVNPFSCLRTWPACKCLYAKRIRAMDMGLNKYDERILEVI